MSALNERIKQSNFQNAGHEAILSLMAAAFTVRDKLNYICQKKNISVVQYNILRILKSIHPQGYSRNEISSRMLERAPDITRIIDRMVKSGLVERIKSRQDMRQSIAIITNRGNTLLAELNTVVQAYQKEFQQKVSKNQCEVLSSICNEILRLNGRDLNIT